MIVIKNLEPIAALEMLNICIYTTIYLKAKDNTTVI
jgi:hypothetical protein